MKEVKGTTTRERHMAIFREYERLLKIEQELSVERAMKTAKSYFYDKIAESHHYSPDSVQRIIRSILRSKTQP